MHESLGIQVDEKVGPVDDYFTPGTKAGLENLEAFARTRLKAYGTSRNDPNVKALSDISPWAHFGQISVQRAALYVKKFKGNMDFCSRNSTLKQFNISKVLSTTLRQSQTHFLANFLYLSILIPFSQPILKICSVGHMNNTSPDQ